MKRGARTDSGGGCDEVTEEMTSGCSPFLYLLCLLLRLFIHESVKGSGREERGRLEKPQTSAAL